ncbi:uncharacterized protein KNAG_0C00740 [Huiozyma naganishii CBS 8797]|uniref:Uncharacterized protein n=1 Tax=Huiozyma naganishii (strain ATCC MYA-139 / BCRC 22969 / CBS 8797 / KCTC 17520 / NBRC 10181 / NCYC 3082 / Yp74L-3) TaxID=1071383 RepID=J7RW35_HUIN7|nr:hypothetical protein KNAG_0C00740 [Kazachstania naganishii CBS 8797]CCK69187.1 hypothetical protein KNAG_0C00740 [Kazachstania naganishii CBS 8797]
MIPYMPDQALLREHIYRETGDLDVVLDKETFDSHGGFKATRQFGLGYFNYQPCLHDEVYEKSLFDMWRCNVYDHFVSYFIILLVVVVWWVAFLCVDFNSLIQTVQRQLRRAVSTFQGNGSNGDSKRHHGTEIVYENHDFEYHHVKA